MNVAGNYCKSLNKWVSKSLANKQSARTLIKFRQHQQLSPHKSVAFQQPLGFRLLLAHVELWVWLFQPHLSGFFSPIQQSVPGSSFQVIWFGVLMISFSLSWIFCSTVSDAFIFGTDGSLISFGSTTFVRLIGSAVTSSVTIQPWTGWIVLFTVALYLYLLFGSGV